MLLVQFYQTEELAVLETVLTVIWVLTGGGVRVRVELSGILQSTLPEGRPAELEPVTGDVRRGQERCCQAYHPSSSSVISHPLNNTHYNSQDGCRNSPQDLLRQLQPLR